MNKKGFTLIELLVAMGIIAVLTGMAVFNFNQARVRARDIQRKNDLSQLQKSLEVYKNDNGDYPLEADFQNTLKTGGYTKIEFNDPRDGEWSDYYYVPAEDRKTYYLMACLENTADVTKTSAALYSSVCSQFSNIFSAPVAAACTCGLPPADSSGVMYTLSQP